MNKKTTNNEGIDYSLGMANKDNTKGIRYGVIHQNRILQAWCDSSEVYYGKHTDEWTDEEWENTEPISFYVDDEEYSMESDDYGDIFITKSPYFTYAQFCSPCAPGGKRRPSPSRMPWLPWHPRRTPPPRTAVSVAAGRRSYGPTVP